MQILNEANTESFGMAEMMGIEVLLLVFTSFVLKLLEKQA